MHAFDGHLERQISIARPCSRTAKVIEAHIMKSEND